jgi:uncharacterized protein (DUF169 family)
MKSKIADALGLKHAPLGLYRGDTPEPGSRQLKKRTSLKGAWGCAMLLLLDSFVNGRTVAYTPETVNCPGSAQAFGFPDGAFREYPGGMMGSVNLLCQGNAATEEGRRAVKELEDAGASQTVIEEFRDGEGYKKDAKAVLEFYGTLPPIKENKGHVTVKPLSRFDGAPEVVIFLADALELSALTILANFARPGAENVIFPFSAGCWSIGRYPLSEIDSPSPRAVVGLSDISARLVMKRLLKREFLSFSVPYSLFSEMEENVEASFITRHGWRTLSKIPRVA